MENLDEQLKIHIHRVLNAASEEAVNGIIHALKEAGLESISDLQFVQENDLTLVLKPIQRRKLVRAWSELISGQNVGASEDDRTITSQSNNYRYPFAIPSQLKRKKPDEFDRLGPQKWYKRSCGDNSTSEYSEEETALTDRSAISSHESNCGGNSELPHTFGETPSTSPVVETVKELNTSVIFDTKQLDAKEVEGPINETPLPKWPNYLLSQNCKWTRKNCSVLLQVYAKYKKELSSCPDVNKSVVWTKIACEIQHKLLLNCNELQCQNKIDNLRREYEAVKKQNRITPRMASLLSEAKNAFEDVENSVVLPTPKVFMLSMKRGKWKKNKQLMLLEIYAKYKTELSQPGIEEQEVWNKIAKEFEEVSSMKCDGSQCRSEVNQLKHEFERLGNKVVANRDDAWYLDKIRKYFETTGTFDEQPNAVELHFRRRNQKYCLKLLQVYAKYKAEFDSPDTDKKKVWGEIVSELRQKYLFNCGESLCRYEISQLMVQYEDAKRRKTKKENKPWFFGEVQKAFENIENLASNDLSVQADELNKKNQLLKVFSKYEAELSHPGAKEHVVWKKIIKDFRLMSCVNYDKSQCCSEINQLRHEYERLKNDVVSDQETAMFLDKAKKYFEVTENQAFLSADQTNSIYLQSCKKNKEYRLKLLQVYNNYKAEFASPDVDERKIWEKIGTELRKKYFYDCGEYLCQFELLQMKRSYEDFKKGGVKSGNKPFFFAEAQKAFESVHLAEVSPEQSNRKEFQSCKNEKQYHLKLLQVYGKYKTEFASPDIEEGEVWGKITTELRERHLYDDEFFCRIELHKMKCAYEYVKKYGHTKPYFFEEAQKVFENVENLGPSSYDVNKVENSSEYIPPHFKSTENEPAVSAKTAGRRNILKVSNLSKDVKISDLQELFESFGKIAFLYKIKSEIDESKCFAFITFLKQEDATRAIDSVDGMEFNKITLKVEWAESSQTNEISKV